MIMREFFKKYLEINDPKVLDELERHSEIWKVKKREIVMTEGEIITDIPFLISGVLKACYYAVDKKSVDELPLTFAEKQAIKIVEKKIKGTDLEILFKESGLFK